MGLDDFKETWQKSTSETKDANELSKMTSASENPRVKRIRLRLGIETLFTIILLSIVMTGLDSGDKPLWSNIALMVAGLLYVTNRIMGYVKLTGPKLDENTREVVAVLIRQIKKLSISSTLTALLLGSTLILSLSINIALDTKKMILLSGMVITMFVLTYLSTRIWRQQINSLKGVLRELSENSDDLI